jgi:hypothetical protein
LRFQFQSKGVVNEKPFRGTPEPKAPEKDNPVESLRAMDKQVKEMPVADKLGPPIQPCGKPWLELTLFDADNRPVPGAPYTIALPSGERRSGVLDETGFVHIDDIEADAAELEAEVRVHLDDNGTVDQYEITVRAKGPAKEDEEEESADEETAFEEIAEFLIR